jgi:alpha-beta hydrolase superfamily lysophospholipase
MIRDTDSAEAGHQYRRPVANPGHGVGGGLHTLVDHFKKAPLMGGIIVCSPWLTPEPAWSE